MRIGAVYTEAEGWHDFLLYDDDREYVDGTLIEYPSQEFLKQAFELQNKIDELPKGDEE